MSKPSVADVRALLSVSPVGANEAPCVVRFTRTTRAAAFTLSTGHENYQRSLELLVEGWCPACFEPPDRRLVQLEPRKLPGTDELWASCARSGGFWKLEPIEAVE